MASSPTDEPFGVTEEEVFQEGDVWGKARDRCAKKENHGECVDVPMDDNFEGLLPPPLDGPHGSALLRHMSSLTGKIKVGSMYCTGFVQAIRQEIVKKGSCKICHNNHPNGVRGYILTVTTAFHVLEKATEENRATMELFWHQGKDLNVMVHLSRVVSTDKDCNEKEWCAAEFVCHDVAKMDEMKKLEDHLKKFQTLQGELYGEYKTNTGSGEQLVIIVSHPHGGPKRISYYTELRDRQIVTHLREDQEWCRYSYDAPTCRGCSGAPIFILGQALCGFGYWLGHPHIHIRSKALEAGAGAVGYSSLGCDHICRG